MKKFIIITISIIILAFSSLITKSFFTKHNTETTLDKNSVQYNGWLHTDGYELKNQKNQPIQLRGLSSHGIEWFSDCITYENLEILKKDWNTNVFRIAMYTDEGNSGYIHNKEFNTQKACEIIDNAIKLDMYVIMDWHILSDKNPQMHQNEAKEFFDYISKKYSDKPNVIYEICNEPNGYDVTWDNNVKPYAEDIIKTIRNNSSKSLIIVGTTDWCKGLKEAADSPLNFDNIIYSCHFYSGSHKSELREKIDYCINKNIPIFISECGLTDASGNGNLYFDEFNEWINYINSHNLSWVYWSFCYKNESSAVLKSDYKIMIDNIKNMNDNNKKISNDVVSYKTSSNISDKTLNTQNDSIGANNYTSENSKISSNSTENNYYYDFNNYLSTSGQFIKNIFLQYK